MTTTAVLPESSALPAHVRRHEISLLLEGRCRKCAEILPKAAVLSGADCPLCHHSTSLSSHERDLLVQHIERRSGVRFGLVAGLVGASQLVVGWFPVVSSVIAGVSAAWIRFQVVRPSLALLSTKRRLISLWTGRIVTSALVVGILIINELLTLIPWLGTVLKVALSAGQVLLVGWVNTRYALWQVSRERQGVPVGWWETLLLGLSVVLLLATSIGLVAAVFAAVHAISTLSQHLLS